MEIYEPQVIGTEKKTTEILVIDRNVPDHETLIEGLKPGIKVIFIDGGNGLKTLAKAIEGLGDIDGLHIISHGSQGAVYLGDDVLSSQTLEQYTEELNHIKTALTQGGDLLFYGCNVAKGSGRDFLYDLARITRADVAASDDITGKSGDWDLEISTGQIEASLGLDSDTRHEYGGDLATFDFTGGAGTAPYNETEGTLTMSVLAAGGLNVADLGNFGGTVGNAAVTSAAGTVTISFDKTVNVSQLLIANTNASVKTIRLTPNVGSAVDSSSLSQDESETVTVNFTGITSFTLTFTSGIFEGFFDNIIATEAPTDPTITSTTYDASSGALVVTGTNIQANGGGSDIDASKFTFTGEGAATYTLTDTADVERTSATEFTLNLSATDKAGVNTILNKNGTSSTSNTTYNIASADDWNTNVTAGDTSDSTNTITVSNVASPAITSATYDYATGALVVSGSNFTRKSGGANDIDISMFTFTGEGGATYTLTSATDVEITSDTSFTAALAGADRMGVSSLLNKNGTTSATAGTTYNLAAAEDWAVGADAGVNVADTTGNGITVSNYAVPTATSATYDHATGQLTVTGTGFVQKGGTANDVDVSKLDGLVKNSK